MKRILLISALVFALFYIPCQAQDFLRAQGGITANLTQLKDGEIHGASQICFLKKSYKNIYLAGSFMNEASNWEDYSGKIIWFTSTPDPTKINLYLVTSGGFTHSAENKIDAGSVGLGVGSVFALKNFNPLIEVCFYDIDGDWISYISTGLQIGLDF